MRTLSAAIVIITFVVLSAQSSWATRLALVSQDASASIAADVLTTELSKREDIQLVERAEIEKVYREQSLSAANKDYLKLGRILGADGLLLLDQSKEGTNEILNVRLVAVKPGVVLSAEKFPWPMKDMAEWAPVFAKKLNPLVPKLQVLAKDAIPISVVNLRSAFPSVEARDTERQLKLLTIQRLTREPQLFVLERQQMQSLSEEKELNTDESPFWNGSYLFEGVVDQNGYVKDTVTINARLTAKGKQPLSFDVSGSRTNLADVVNAVAIKVAALLKVTSTVKGWNAAEEAQQYFDEAKWALRWGVLPEAQGAAESAWALGKQDQDCALLRLDSYLPDVDRGNADFDTGNMTGPGDMDIMGITKNMVYSRKPLAAVFKTHPAGVYYAAVYRAPETDAIKRAVHLLNLFIQRSKNLPEGELRPGTLWHERGLRILIAASGVLRRFHFVASAQVSAEDDLKELREMARILDTLIENAARNATSAVSGERNRFSDSRDGVEFHNIFACETVWGCYWQDTPEDCIDLYRKLMRRQDFAEFHKRLWFRELMSPAFTAWNDDARRRSDNVWREFIKELTISTNVFLQLEGTSVALANAETDQAAVQNFNAIVETIYTNLDTILNNPELTPCLDWPLEELVFSLESSNPANQEGSHVITKTGDELRNRIKNEFAPRMRQAKETQTAKLAQEKGSQTFEKQKEYLAKFTPFSTRDFISLFQPEEYSKRQADEIQPLIAAYKSNLLAKAESTTSLIEKSKARGAISTVEFFLERPVADVLKPKPKPKVEAIASPIATPAPLPSKRDVATQASTAPADRLTNILVADRFLPIPVEDLQDDSIGDVTITAHHWIEGKLVLDLRYGASIDSFDDNGNWKSTRNVVVPAIAILDPAILCWEVIGGSPVNVINENPNYHHTTLWHGVAISSDDGAVRKFDRQANKWQTLNIPDLGNCSLFNVNGRLYATTGDQIVEIMDGGASTRLLASNRRRPAVSVLDTQDLGRPMLFSGPKNALRATAAGKIMEWDGNDWRAICSAPSMQSLATISSEDVLFFGNGWSGPAGIWRIRNGENSVDYCFGQKRQGGIIVSPLAGETQPLWKLPLRLALPKLAVASRGADIYLLADHSKLEEVTHRDVVVEKKAIPQDGYHAELLCFAHGSSEAQKVGLKFEGDKLSLPVNGLSNRSWTGGERAPGWILFSTNQLFLGAEDDHPNPQPHNPYSNKVEPKPGVWMISLKTIDAEITRQRELQRKQNVDAEAKTKKAWDTLLGQYDKNHNGRIDEDEREEALGETAFIKAELNGIDTNHNGWLDLWEVSYFDANHNKTLEEKEEAGIHIAQRQLAENLMQKYASQPEGLLREQYETMVKETLHNNNSAPYFQNADRDHNGFVDCDELELLEKERTTFWPMLQEVWINGTNPLSNFKTRVEAYWADSKRISSQSDPRWPAFGPSSRTMRPHTNSVSNP